MTTGGPVPGNTDCCGDAAAYALGALEPPEVERFRHHLESCIVCRDELIAMQAAVDVLPVSAPQHRAPRALRRRVMRDVRSEPALTARSERRRHWPLMPAGVHRPALAAGLLAAAAFGTVGAIELSSGGSSAARVIQASVTGVPGSAQLRVTEGHAELVVRHLPPPPPGRIYELWIKRGSRPPAPTRALFSVTAAGAAEVGVPGKLSGVNTIMVTAEPAGGSLVPTHAPVIVAHL